MEKERLAELLKRGGYIRTGGSPEELNSAEMLQEEVRKLGFEAKLEAFPVQMAKIEAARLIVDGREINCKGYQNALNTGPDGLKAALYYQNSDKSETMSAVKGKIVLLDGYLRKKSYAALIKNGAVGFITYNGDPNYDTDDIDTRELRSAVTEGLAKIPGVQINVKDAIKLVAAHAQNAELYLKEKEFTGESHNVVVDVKGEKAETIVLTAHYDSTALSCGVYDNLSGTVSLLAILAHFQDKKPHYSLRFIWCGSEERGLLGSKAYLKAHEAEAERFLFNINLDMLGSVMGTTIACCTTMPELVSYLNYFADLQGYNLKAYQDVYSSDSSSFANRGIPAVSFARVIRSNIHPIHNRYDTIQALDLSHLQEDIAFITRFCDDLANAVYFPIKRKIPENMVDALAKYFARKDVD